MTLVCTRGGPPTDRDQATIDAFAVFLQLRSGVQQRVADGRYREGQPLPPWHRYTLRLAAWRIGR